MVGTLAADRDETAGLLVLAEKLHRQPDFLDIPPEIHH
jgi:hypothetical protein